MSKKLFLLLVTLLPAISGMCQSMNELEFFDDGIGWVDTIVNLVADYGVNANDSNDDSEKLQQAIDEVSALPNGGRIDLPSGTYYLSGIYMKNNVHLVIDSLATIVSAQPTGVIFSFGLGRKGNDALLTIQNASIRSNGGKYTVDISMGGVNEKLWFANCRNVNNFMIEGFKILDHYTKMSGVTLNLAQQNELAFMATNGVVKNGDIEHAHVGYGLIQVQCAKHILFKNLAGQGGVTLRMESGAVANSPDYIKIDSIWARNISTRYGSSAFIMGSHTKVNGFVNIDSVSGISSGSVGSVGRGFVTDEEAAEGKVPGHFSPDCVIKNIHGVFGTQAQVKWKNFDQIPCPLRDLISDTTGPDNASYLAPSFGVFGWNDTLITNISNITGEGYEYGHIIYSKADEVADCSMVAVADLKSDAIKIFPNPATDYLTISGCRGADIEMTDTNGKIVKKEKSLVENMTLDIAGFNSGIYFVKITNNNAFEIRKIMIK